MQVKPLKAVRASTKIDFVNIVEMQRKACTEFKANPIFGSLIDGTFDWISYAEFGVMVERFRHVLTRHEIGKNDKVALICNNRVEWAVAMYAVAGVGAQLVPMYEAQSGKDWSHIIKDSGAKLLLVGPEFIYEKTKDYVGTLGNLKSILCFDAPSDLAYSYTRWMDLVVSEPALPPISVAPLDDIVINYTSGTTGPPKGVVLSHDNIVQVLYGMRVVHTDASNEKEGIYTDRSLSFLPWAHLFGQVCDLHYWISSGSAQGIIANKEDIVPALNMIKPTVMCAVPALLYKVYDGVNKKLSQAPAWTQRITSAAFKIARHRNHLLEFDQKVGLLLDLQFQLADKIVFSKIRDNLGGNIRYMGSGGAALSLPVLHFFEDIGMPICEGYGLTETSPIMSQSGASWASRRLGCVGIALHNLDLRILNPETLEEVLLGDEGEVCGSGRSIMSGYHNNVSATEECFVMKDGKRFFRTGDLGRIIDGKFLKITGRIKEQFKLENGKFVVPGPVEDFINRSIFIHQCFLHGINRQYTVLLVVPEMIELRLWAKSTLGAAYPGDGVGSEAILMEMEAVKTLMSDEIKRAFPNMKHYEKPHRWLPLPAPFTQENEMMTAKMSLRRNTIVKLYASHIEALYNNKEGVVVIGNSAHEV